MDGLLDVVALESSSRRSLLPLAASLRRGTHLDRDGVRFYVEPGSAFQPVTLVRTPGLRRDRAPGGHPPPPPSAA